MSSTLQTKQDGQWVILVNLQDKPQLLSIEPYGIGWDMLPSEEYYVYLLEKPPHLPKIRYYDGGIQVFAEQAVVYRGNERLFDYGESNLYPPCCLQLEL